MFPIRDHNPPERASPVTWALLAANVVVFALTWAGPLVLRQWALYPLAVSMGQPGPGLVTHMFLHAGLLHLAGNLLFLWVFGPNLEDQMGRLAFLAFYLACGVLAALAHVASAPRSMVPMVGASGAIAGVMGGYLLLFPRARVDVIAVLGPILRRYRVRAWVVIGAWVALQLGMGTFAQGETGPAYWAHVGGFAAGLVLTLPLFLRRGGRAFWALNDGRPPHPPRLAASRVPVVRRR